VASVSLWCIFSSPDIGYLSAYEVKPTDWDGHDKNLPTPEGVESSFLPTPHQALFNPFGVSLFLRGLLTVGFTHGQ